MYTLLLESYWPYYPLFLEDLKSIKKANTERGPLFSPHFFRLKAQPKSKIVLL